VPGRSPKDEFGITLRVVQSIVLPNGRSYQAAYNDKGYLDRITLPSEAYIRYTYWRDSWVDCSPTYQTGSRDGWNVASRVVSADGTAASEKVTTYSYVYEQHVDPYCDCGIHGPIDHTTVTDPAGGKTVHNFDSNGHDEGRGA